MTRLLTPREVADRFHVTPRTIQRWARDRRVPHTRIGRRVLFTPEQADAITRIYEVLPVKPEPSATIRNPNYRPHAVAVAVDPRHRTGSRA